MRQISRRWIIHAITLSALFTAVTAPAAITLPPIFRDHMVLQQGIPVPVWGTAGSGDTVTVEFAGQLKTARAGADGTWRIALDPLRASSRPAEMRVGTTGAPQAAVLRDILVGEVWLCAGQSNMQFGLGSAAEGKEAAAEADIPMIRQFRHDQWTVCSPETAVQFTAVGFFFARELHAAERVPVGILNEAIGGTMIRAWTSRQAQHDDVFLNDLVISPWESLTADVDAQIRRWQALAARRGQALDLTPEKVLNGAGQEPGELFDRWLKPIAPYAIRGAIWYQAESDAWGFPIASIYARALPVLIRDWRRHWGQGEFPVLVVQLPGSYLQPLPQPPTMSPWNLVQEAQADVSRSLANVYTVVSLDMGDTDIHPKRKEAVGRRCALAALANVYGKRAAWRGPVLRSMAVRDGRAVLAFDHAEGGLNAGRLADVKGVGIAGADRRFFWAQTRIERDTLLVWSRHVPEPVAVRYAFFDSTCEPGELPPETNHNLYNQAGLPAGPFRTDDWSWDIPPQEHKTAVARRVSAPPRIDGDLSDAAWQQAEILSGFLVHETYCPATHPTELRLVFDDRNLYAAFRCGEPHPQAVTARAGKPDDEQIWSDDNVQLFLDTDRDRRSYIRIVVNAAGMLYDADAYNDAWGRPRHNGLQLLSYGRYLEPGWDAGCTLKSGKEAGAWTVELAIPWSALGRTAAPEQDTEMGLYAARTHAASGERSEWCTIGRDRHSGAMMPYRHVKGCIQHHAVSRFGTLRFEE